MAQKPQERSQAGLPITTHLGLLGSGNPRQGIRVTLKMIIIDNQN
jgi:hypothetical protein